MKRRRGVGIDRCGIELVLACRLGGAGTIGAEVGHGRRPRMEPGGEVGDRRGGRRWGRGRAGGAEQVGGEVDRQSCFEGVDHGGGGGEDALGGGFGELEVAVGPAGEVGDGVAGGLQVDGAAQQVGDRLGFDLHQLAGRRAVGVAVSKRDVGPFVHEGLEALRGVEMVHDLDVPGVEVGAAVPGLTGSGGVQLDRVSLVGELGDDSGPDVLPAVLAGEQSRQRTFGKVGWGDELALVEHLDGAEPAHGAGDDDLVAGGFVDVTAGEGERGEDRQAMFALADLAVTAADGGDALPGAVRGDVAVGALEHQQQLVVGGVAVELAGAVQPVQPGVAGRELGQVAAQLVMEPFDDGRIDAHADASTIEG